MHPSKAHASSPIPVLLSCLSCLSPSSLFFRLLRASLDGACASPPSPPPGALKLGREALSPDVHDALAAFVLDMVGAEVGLAGTLLAGLPSLGLTMQARLYLMVGLCWVGWLIG